MIEFFITFAETSLLPLGILGIFLASVLEEIIAPIPSPLVMTAAGFLFLEGSFSAELLYNLIFIIAIPSALGVALGSLVVFYAAYWGGKPLLVRWGKLIGLSWNDVLRMQEKFKQTSTDNFLLFGLRVVPIIPSVAISAFFGLLRYNVFRYLLYTFLGTIIRASILALIGWQAGSFYHRYAETIGRFESFFLAVLLAGSLAFIGYRVWKKRQKRV